MNYMSLVGYKSRLKTAQAWAPWLPMIVLPIMVFQACQRKDLTETSNPRLVEKIETLKRSPEILLIVPDGFSGPLQIVKDPEHGQQLALENNKLVVQFPTNGIAIVRDFAVFEKPHVLKAQYYSGHTLKVDPDESSPSKEKNLWQLGSSQGTKYPLETMLFLVCTTSEKDELARGLR